MNNRLVIVTGVGLAAVLMVSTLLQARPQAPHLPAVGEYGTVLAYSVVLDGDDACIGTTTGIAIVRIANAVSIENLASELSMCPRRRRPRLSAKSPSTDAAG